MSDPLILVVVLALLVLSSGFFSTAEAALFTLSPTSLDRLFESGSRSARVIRMLIENPGRLTVTLGVGHEIAGVALVTFIAWAVASGAVPAPLSEIFRPHPLGWGLLLSFLVLVFMARAFPKAVGVYYSPALARAVAYPVLVLRVVFYPAWRFFMLAARLLMKWSGARSSERGEGGMDSADIQGLMEVGSREGLLDVTERELLANILRSADTTAGDIMTPRQDMVSVKADAVLEEARRLLEDHDYSRIPVTEDGEEKVVGIITAKALLKPRMLGRQAREVMVREVMRPALFVPDSRRLGDLLLDFRQKRTHMALVVDEFGSLSGLVTLEDVLEEIFGEVHEDEEPEFECVGDNRWEMQGRVEIEEFNTRTGSSLPGNSTRTMAGLVVALLGRRPRPGDQVEYGGFRFQVLESRGIIVHRLRAARIEE